MTEPDVATAVMLRVDELAAHVAQLTRELTDLSAAVFSGPATSGPATVAEPMYDTLDGWVGEYFAPSFTRPIGGEIRWCAQWAEHAEAVTRLEALWRSWETLRLDPAVGMATWLTNYLDPQLAALLLQIRHLRPMPAGPSQRSAALTSAAGTRPALAAVWRSIFDTP